LAFVEFPVERRNNLPDLVHEGSWNWHHELVGRKRGVYSTDDVSDTTHYKASDSSKIGNVSMGKQLSISTSNVMAVHASLPLHGQNKTRVSR
jgi:hypothetical protein